MDLREHPRRDRHGQPGCTEQVTDDVGSIGGFVIGNNLERQIRNAIAVIGEREIFRLRTSVLGGCAYLIRLGAAASMLSSSRTPFG